MQQGDSIYNMIDVDQFKYYINKLNCNFIEGLKDDEKIYACGCSTFSMGAYCV